MTVADSTPRVGVGCLVIRDGLWLLIRRRNAHGSGHWSTPGGYLDSGETIQACAAREVREETGLDIEHLEFLGVTNDVFDSGAHFVTIWMAGEARLGTPVPDPQEVDEFGWFPSDALPAPRFLSFENLLQGRRLGSPPANSRLHPTLALGSRG